MSGDADLCTEKYRLIEIPDGRFDKHEEILYAHASLCHMLPEVAVPMKPGKGLGVQVSQPPKERNAVSKSTGEVPASGGGGPVLLAEDSPSEYVGTATFVGGEEDAATAFDVSDSEEDADDDDEDGVEELADSRDPEEGPIVPVTSLMRWRFL